MSIPNVVRHPGSRQCRSSSPPPARAAGTPQPTRTPSSPGAGRSRGPALSSSAAGSAGGCPAVLRHRATAEEEAKTL